jgi:hypothetical protein
VVEPVRTTATVEPAEPVEPASPPEDEGGSSSKSDALRVPIASPHRTIAASANHTCAIVRVAGRETDQIKCWGSNDRGELGLGDRRSRVAANEQMGDALPFVVFEQPDRIVSLDAGSGRTCALQASGKLWCWGQALDSVDDEDSRSKPELVQLAGPVSSFALGEPHACASLLDGSVHCWGWGASVGDRDGHALAEPAVVELGKTAHARSVVVGSDHTCTLFDSGRIKCFGAGRFGSLGLDDTRSRGPSVGEMGDDLPFVDLGSSFTTALVTGGGMHTCALSVDHRVKCWGANRVGQLGAGHSESPGAKPGQSRIAAATGDARPFVDLGRDGKVVDIAAGNSHTCALIQRTPNDIGLKCWGTGALGVFPPGTRGDEPGEMGDALPFVDLGTNLVPIALALASHTCAVVVDRSDIANGARPSSGGLKCWGSPEAGASGIEEDQWDFERPETMGDGLAFVDLGRDVRVVVPPVAW